MIVWARNRGYSLEYLLDLPLAALSDLIEREAKEYAKEKVILFQTVSLAFGGEKKDRENFLKPFLEALGQSTTKTGDDLAKDLPVHHTSRSKS